ncbi:MAG: deoxyribose-phosphate aldolase [Bacteroidales bacterium]
MELEINIKEQLDLAQRRALQLEGEQQLYGKLLSFIDLTSLGSTDTVEKIAELTRRVNDMEVEVPSLPSVAAICVYPNFVATVKSELKCSSVKIASVSGAFPSSQSFLKIKREEAKMAIESGAEELDIVLPLHLFFAEEYGALLEEILAIREVAGNSTLKVIIESGLLNGGGQVERAAALAIEGGADFVKTSTGKVEPAATPLGALSICNVIARHYQKSGEKIGFKAAGGISTPQEALLYYSIVETILGKEWIDNSLFRIGASRLANNLIASYDSRVKKYF